MNNSKIVIGGVEKFSAVDFPNTLSAVIFMQGCPWKCPFCHNASIRDILPENDFSWDKFYAFLQKRVGRLDAVTFSGGEPLLQDCLADYMRQVRSLGFKIGLHTGGYRPEHLADVLSLVDWVGLDIKTDFDARKYQVITGANHLKNVQKSLDLLLSWGGNFECRTTCDPRFLTIDDLYAIAQNLHAKGVKKYFLQKYRPIASDTSTSDDMCEKLLSDERLLSYLRSNFSEFAVRR
ncbi:MAG: anaerobic ribonucleoside-triphosphate reductase activating protein [Alphaproteobacteria bacterium]|nr:anaerobic ribonucleoside-triphosphate reductase activating protein [Alphaproteobacteria bacterium]MBQ9234923.1 anaerobic ribonucleoside-triphosphate reductase activating protein [Alphaproteobacteria bacterium]